MRPVVRIHALLGSGVDSGLAGFGQVSSLRLPGGTTATRWLSRGASPTRGLGAEVERILNGAAEPSPHCVADLRDPMLDLEALTDELDPRWGRGLPRALEVLGEIAAQLPELGAKGEFAGLVVDCPGDGDVRRLRKIWSWCRTQRMGMVVRSEPGSVPGLDGPVFVSARDGAASVAEALRSLGTA